MLNIYKINRIELLKKLLLLSSFLLTLFLFKIDFISIKVILWCGIYLNIILISKYFNHKPFMIINIFNLIYLFYLIPYYHFDIYISDYFIYQKELYINKILIIHVFFLLCIYIFLKKEKNYLVISNCIKKIYSPVAFYGLLIFIFFCLLFLMKGVNIYSSENTYYAYMDNLRGGSGLPEYLLVFIVVLFIFTNSKIEYYLFNILILFFIYKLFVYGFRVQTLMLLLLYYILILDEKLKPIVVFYSSLFGFILMSFVGILKDGGKADLIKLFFNTENGFILSHHTGVIYSSTTQLGLVSDGILNFYDRVYGSFGFIMNTIIPGRFIKEYIPEGQIHSFAKRFAEYGGGGLPEVTMYYYFGFIGVIGFAFLFSLFVNYSLAKQINKNNIYSIICIIIFLTFPRWLSYDPANFFFRLPIYGVLLYFFIDILIKVSKRRRIIEST